MVSIECEVIRTELDRDEQLRSLCREERSPGVLFHRAYAVATYLSEWP